MGNDLAGMRVGIATNWSYPDYGGMLQALATQTAVSSLGCNVEVLDARNLQANIDRRKLRYFAKHVLDFSILKEKGAVIASSLREKLPGEYGVGKEKRRKAFCAFRDEHFKPSNPLESWEAAREASRKYDCILVGSDQLWLPSNIAGDFYTLGFVPDEVRKISYATSFGVSSMPSDLRDRTKSFLMRFASLSAREASGQEIIYDLTGRKVPLVCDPTLLVEQEQWMSLVSERAVPDEPYIFCYLMGNNPDQRQFAQRLKQITGLSIVALPHLDRYIASDEGFPDNAPYEVGPDDFLGLIKNASLVCTDSFHGTVFSCIFNRSFLVFPRFTKKSTLSTNTRIESLLSCLEIENRFVGRQVSPDECLDWRVDFVKLNESISRFRERSFAYLVQAFKTVS